MLLILYDLDHKKIAGLKNHKNACVESELSSGEKTLSFLWHQSNRQKIPQEYYIRTDTDEFVVKENTKDNSGYRKITANLNLEDIEGRAWREFIIKDVTAQEVADYALTDTGWTCVSTVSKTKKRNISLKKVSSLQVIEKILDAFTCEVSYDTINKVVYLKETIGEDRGAYFMEGLNVTELSDNSDSYDFATIIVPFGADDLNIESVNGGNNYLENYQYSKKKKMIIWEDSNYTDAQALMEDAEYKLNEISKPRRTMRVKVLDLAKQKPEYSVLAYSVGDTVTVISNKQGIREKQRITKTTEYLESPGKNTCDISNTVLSFEDLQAKLFAAAECIDNITTDNGTVKGSSVDKIDVTQIIGLERYISEDIDDLKVNYLYVRTEFGTPYAVIGQAIMTQSQVTNLNVTGREDVTLSYITELHAETLSGTTAVFKTIESDNISALEARIDKITSTDITTEYLEAHYAQIDYANVDVAAIRQGFLTSLMVSQGIIADRVVGTEVVATDVLTGVNIYANDITAGTLSVDRLVFRGSEQSIVYQLNQITGALQAENVDTLNGEVITPRTITTDRIVANAITANEIDLTNLVSTGLIGANKLTAANIEVDDLFAMNITAAGSIRSSNYAYTSGNYSTAGIKMNMATGQIWSKKFAIDASGNAYFAGNLSAPGGNIGGFTIGTKALYNGTNSMTSTAAGVYLGTDGIRQYKSASVYTQIQDGKLTCIGANIKGSIYLDNSVMMWHAEDESISGARYEQALSWELLSGVYCLRLGGNAAMTNYMHVYNDLYVYNNASVSGNLSAKTVTISSTVNFAGDCYFAGGKTYRIDSTGVARLQGVRVGSSGTYGLNSDGSGVLNALSTAGKITVNGGIEIGTDGGFLSKVNLKIVNGKWLYTYNTSGTLTRLIGMNDSNNVHMGDYNGDNISPVYLHAKGKQYNFTDAAFCPNVTNDVPLGLPTKLWKVVNAKTGTISTSDRNEKKDIEDIPEIYEKLFMMVNPKIYMFKDGDRIHIGAISQDIEESMNELGLQPEQFAGFCKDAVYDYTAYNDDGTPVEESKVLMRNDDGSVHYRYALRYQEFIMLTVHMVQKCIEKLQDQDMQLQLMTSIILPMQHEIEQLKLQMERMTAVA